MLLQRNVIHVGLNLCSSAQSSLQWLSVGGYLSSLVTADWVGISRIYKLTTRPVIDGDVKEIDWASRMEVDPSPPLYFFLSADVLQTSSSEPADSAEEEGTGEPTHTCWHLYMQDKYTSVLGYRKSKAAARKITFNLISPHLNHIRLYADDAAFYIFTCSWI